MGRPVGDLVQKYVLDPFYHARTWALDGLVWSAVRLAAYEIPFADVREKRRRANQVHADLNLDAAGDLDGLAKFAEAQLKEAVARRTLVTDKCKVLFTFNTALLALIAVFQGKITELTSWEVAAFYAAVVSLVVALLVLWTYFDVTGEVHVRLGQETVGLSKADLQKSLVNTNLLCAVDADNRTDYLVDLYRTSRLYMMIGFVLLFAVFSHNYFGKAGAASGVDELRDDPRVQAIVRGAAK